MGFLNDADEAVKHAQEEKELADRHAAEQAQEEKKQADEAAARHEENTQQGML